MQSFFSGLNQFCFRSFDFIYYLMKIRFFFM